MSITLPVSPGHSPHLVDDDSDAGSVLLPPLPVVLQPVELEREPSVGEPPESAEQLPEVAELAEVARPRRAAGLTRANLRAGTADGATFGVMVGAGESYLAAFALAIGLGEISAGLVSSVPLLVGGVLQLISLRAVHWFGSEKRWVVCCATLQALSFLPLIAVAASGSITLVPLLAIASLYWAAGLASGPAWNTWMESIVPPRIRPRYFSVRTRTSQICTLAGLVGAGIVLQWADNRGQTLTGFACIFAAAAAFRMWSVSWLVRHRTAAGGRATVSSGLSRVAVVPPAGAHPAASRTSAAVTAAIAKPAVKPSGGNTTIGTGGIRLLAYLVTVQGMVQISGPFFSPYMLMQLHFSYSQFVTLLAIGFLSKIIALSWWGKVTRRYGAQRLLWIGGVGIVPLSSLWIFSHNVYQLALVQAASGVMWAAYELGFFLMFFETLPIEKRTRLLTFYNLANTAALCCGTFVGAALLSGLGGDRSAYLVLFGLSSLGRFAALGLLFGAHLRPRQGIHLFLRVLGVRPSASMVDSPILSTLETRREN